MRSLLLLLSFIMVFEGDSRTYQDSWTGTVSYGMQSQGVVVATNGARFTTFELRADDTDNLFSQDGDMLFVWGGVNATNDGKTAEQIHNEMRAYCQDRQARGWYVVAFTEIDADPAIKTNWDIIQPELNALIRANWSSYADKLVDLGARRELSDYSNVLYFLDGVHLTEAGNAVVADAVIRAFNETYRVYIPMITKGN